jgi:hypothetical protein
LTINFLVARQEELHVFDLLAFTVVNYVILSAQREESLKILRFAQDKFVRTT